MPLRLFPLQITLRLTRATKLRHHPAAGVCSLLKTAGGVAGLGSNFPPGMMPDAVEVGRMFLGKGEAYNFGLTLWDEDADHCQRRWRRMLNGLRHVGKQSSQEQRTHGLGGNFVVQRVVSLVDSEGDGPLPIPDEWLERQVEEAARHKTLTIRWLSPLCAQLPNRFDDRTDGGGRKRAGYFDAGRFPLHDLLNRLVLRLRNEFHLDLPDSNVAPADAELVDPPGLGRLHWIKWQYGEGKEGDSLFGVMGRVVVRVRRGELLRPLVLGQFSAVGEKTNFGLGRYAIEEVQSVLPPEAPPYLRARRALSLAELAFAGPVVEGEAHRLNISTHDARRVAERIVAGDYQAAPAERFLLPGDKPRVIALPSRPERVLQRAVHELLLPVLDQFLTDSCQAYRRGFGRQTAARRIQQAFGQGWRWALKADFHHFFDSVDHALLRDKLEVYVQDGALVDLLMQWVAAGAPRPGRGLPTGAVVSPLLANLFLEQFDRQVQEDGGFLVRYADDFVLLFRDPGKGREVLARSAELAERLKLHLNDDKTRLLDLGRTPFDFLGFRFFAEKGWQYHADGLKQIEDLGWREAPRGKPLDVEHALPGEQGLETSRSGIWIVGPQIDWIGIEGPDVVCRSRSQGTEDRFQRRRVAELIVLGSATLDQSLFRHRGEGALGLFIADEIGRWTSAVTDEPPLEVAHLVRAQVALSADAEQSLAIARRLVRAKLINHAVLAEAYPARGTSGQLSRKLRSMAEHATSAADERQLLGIEGAGAAAWYGEFERRIDRRYRFERREHPRAGDPVNVMLNLAQTILHRVICLVLIREGFAPSIGILHKSGERHAALASDMQEVFRHLMDRVVIDATRVIAPGEFHETSHGDFPLRMEAGATRTLIASVFRALAVQCGNAQGDSPRSYRRLIATQCRSLHRHILNPEAQLKLFEHR
ncbi:MAG: CRISPR-associated endonuclease Cas1 [Pirellulaceae bacterium]|nr:CRISPR-associated endonuclease Cas1 [Pirellulaceae bacterium]